MNLMPDPVQGQPPVDPATPSGQGQPASDPATPQPVQGQPQIPPDAPHFQQLYNQTLAEKLALQQQLASLSSAPQQTQADPRPDPQTDWAGYLKWEIRQGQRELLQQFREEEKRNWQGALQQP